MIRPKIAFVVYGVHKDGLVDPMGTPFIDDQLVADAKQSLRNAGVDLVEYDLIIASKSEARECLGKLKKMDDVDAVVLFSGTWVWSAHLIGPIRDYRHAQTKVHAQLVIFYTGKAQCQPGAHVSSMLRAT